MIIYLIIAVWYLFVMNIDFYGENASTLHGSDQCVKAVSDSS